MSLFGCVQVSSSFVDRHRFDAVRIRNRIFMLLTILMRILPQVSHILENHSFSSLQCFFFLISAKDVIIWSTLTAYWNIVEKRILSTFRVPGTGIDTVPIRIGKPWMPIPFRVRQNYVDPTRTGSGPQHWCTVYIPRSHTLLLYSWIKAKDMSSFVPSRVFPLCTSTEGTGTGLYVTEQFLSLHLWAVLYPLIKTGDFWKDGIWCAFVSLLCLL